MRGRGGWGEPKAPTPDLGPRASFLHWPWAAPAPHLKGKRVGTGRCSHSALGAVSQDCRHGRGGPRPRPRSPQPAGPAVPSPGFPWPEVTAVGPGRPWDALQGPPDCGFPPQPARAPGGMLRLPRQPTAVSGKGPEEARAPRPVCARGRELRYRLRNREASEARGDHAPREGGGQAFCSYPESGPGCQGSFWG